MLKKLLSKIFGSTEPEDQSEPEPKETGKRHVMSSSDGWVILRHLNDTSSEHFHKKKDALREAKKVVKEKGLRLVVHRQDGTVQREHDYS